MGKKPDNETQQLRDEIQQLKRSARIMAVEGAVSTAKAGPQGPKGDTGAAGPKGDKFICKDGTLWVEAGRTAAM